jgi:hypothetical protein
LQNDGQNAALAENLLLQARYEGIHLLARLTIARYLKGHVVVWIAYKKRPGLVGLARGPCR